MTVNSYVERGTWSDIPDIISLVNFMHCAEHK